MAGPYDFICFYDIIWPQLNYSYTMLATPIHYSMYCRACYFYNFTMCNICTGPVLNEVLIFLSWPICDAFTGPV